MTVKYIRKSVENAQNILSDFKLYNIPVEIISSFNKKINLKGVLNKIENLVPSHLVKNIDVIYVADIKEFYKNNNSFNAMYKDRAIYVSPFQDNDADLLDDIIHEIAHSFEKEYYDIIYDDYLLEREFLAKRRTLYFLLDDISLDMIYFKNTNYNAKFDNYLHNVVGYDKINSISSGLFYSPYAITSLREYWANGFENYLLGDRQRLKDISPILYNKILNILDIEV